MFPDQQNNNGGQPPAPYQPPQTGVNSAPQQAANGQYEVVPPLPVGTAAGHGGHNPYEFIVNPQQVKQPGISLFGGGGFGKRIAVIAGAAVVLMIVIVVIGSAISPKSGSTGLPAIAERQQEIIRVATAAATAASSEDTQNFASNVELSVSSSQVQLLTYMQTHGTKLKSKQLALDQSAATDATLANAATANTYDSAAVQNLTEQLQVYASLVQTSYNASGSATAKILLRTCFTSAQQLIDQAKTIP